MKIPGSDMSVGLPSITTLAAPLVVLSLFFYLFLTYWRLRDIPGPFWAKFTDLQRMLWVKTMRAHKIHQETHEKYGDCVRLGPNMVSLSDPAAIPALYPMRAGFPKSLFYRGIMPYTKGGALPAVFTTQDEQQHKTLKTPVASLYSLSNVITFEPFVDQVLESLFQQLDRRFVKTRANFDLADWLGYFAWEVMALMTFSKTYGLLESGTDSVGTISAVWNFMLAIGPMTQFPSLDRLLYKSTIADMLKNQVAVPILRVVSKGVEDRQNNDGKELQKDADIPKGDFLSHFMRIQATNPSVPSWACRTWTFSNVIAGSDSTTSIMKACMYNLLANPTSLEKLYQELRNTEKISGLTRPYPKWNEVKDLPYLDACFYEGLRIHPPFVLPLERIAPKGGVFISGHYFAEGVCIGMNPYVINRHKPTWGEDAEFWRPERWLVDDPEQRKKLEGNLMTFGAGRRTCIGRYIAALEVKKIVAALVLNYEIKLPDPKTYHTESSYFFKQEGINVVIQKRIS